MCNTLIYVPRITLDCNKRNNEVGHGCGEPAVFALRQFCLKVAFCVIELGIV